MKRIIFTLSLLFTCGTLWAQVIDKFILDMVHHNPGEPLTQSAFNHPEFLKKEGYNGQVINDFTFAHAALTFDKLNPDIFPQGSKERAWVNDAAVKVKNYIKNAHQAGIKIYYFTDIIVLPKKLIALYKDEICDKNGKVSFEREKTIEIHKIMLDELFDTFPDLDGLVIRTGETYLNNVPYHSGNGPITNGEASHIKLLQLLREEVCEKRNKKIFYRTWSFGGMHEEPKYYLGVTDAIKPHPNLVFSIKHTKGDYHRTFSFNPTLGIGNHPQIVEVQAQREYEGKGAYPNYVAEGVINGFEEYQNIQGLKSLEQLKRNKNFKGIWTWSRGGGWVGPYIKNEFWCRLNAFVLGRWGLNPTLSEAQVFNQFMDEEGITDAPSRTNFRKLSLLSAKAVLRGHASAAYPFEQDWVWWMRDEFLSGIDNPNIDSHLFPSEGYLYKAFSSWYNKGLLMQVIKEKHDAVKLWTEIYQLSKNINMANKEDQAYIQTSSLYGFLLHQIIANGWEVMALGFTGDKTGKYDKEKLKAAIKKYDVAWQKYLDLKKTHPDCATLYKPYAFIYQKPSYHADLGMDASVNKYRLLFKKL
jgi:hypothetical protein